MFERRLWGAMSRILMNLMVSSELIKQMTLGARPTSVTRGVHVSSGEERQSQRIPP